MRKYKHINPDGSEVQIWLGEWARNGEWARIGEWASIGNNIAVPDGLNGITFQMGFRHPMTVSGDVIISGCHTKTPEEWLVYLTPEQCQREGLQECYRPYYVAFVEMVIRLRDE